MGHFRPLTLTTAERGVESAVNRIGCRRKESNRMRYFSRVGVVGRVIATAAIATRIVKRATATVLVRGVLILNLVPRERRKMY